MNKTQNLVFFLNWCVVIFVFILLAVNEKSTKLKNLENSNYKIEISDQDLKNIEIYGLHERY